MTKTCPFQLSVESPEHASWPKWHLSMWLTIPADLRRNELQVLVHGAGTDHRYWDSPLFPETYSYVRWATRHGIATLNIDRIGCGHSTHPPGAEVSVAAQVDGLTQLIRTIRSPGAGLPQFDRVVLVGHSMGSVVCGIAASCSEVDTAVLTGYLPVDGTQQMGDELFEYAFERALDGLPHLHGIVDEDYLVPREGLGVEQLRYWAPQTDPAMIEFDRWTKGPATKAELAEAALSGPAIRNITVPTLALVGQHDTLLIDGAHGEHDTYDTIRRVSTGIGSNFDFVVAPDSGHMLNFQRNAVETYVAIDQWLDSCANRPALL